MFCCGNPFKGRRGGERERWGEMWRVKVVVVGDSQSGKTSLIQRYCTGTLPPTYTPTLFDSCTVSNRVGDRQVQMIIQDTAGQEDLDRLRPPFYLHTDVIVVCFSADKADSWEKVHKVWVPEVRRYCGKHAPLLLVANKTDLLFGPVDYSPPSPHHQGQGRGISNVDDLRSSACSGHPAFRDSPLRSSVSSDNPPVFRDCPLGKDQGENGDSGRDSGFFEVNEPAGLCGTPEDQHSLLADRESTAVNTKHTKGAKKTHGGRSQASKTDRVHTAKRHISRKDRVRPSLSSDGSDLHSDLLGSTEERGRSLATLIGAVGYFETSAVHDRGIEQVFQTALTSAMGTKQWRKKYRL